MFPPWLALKEEPEGSLQKRLLASLEGSDASLIGADEVGGGGWSTVETALK